MDPIGLPKLVTELYRVIAVEESDIERLRQVFSHMREFTMNQRALFDIFDTTKVGKLTADEMLKFMVDNLVAGVNIGDCREIIAEFDSNQDGTLNYDEFLNIFLPADVHKKELHQIHFQAWKKGLKSLYYCRSKSIQRAENINNGLSTNANKNELKEDSDYD